MDLAALWSWAWPVLDWFLCGAWIAALWSAIVTGRANDVPGMGLMARAYVWWRSMLWKVIITAYDGRL